jgi:hypothetical protein
MAFVLDISDFGGKLAAKLIQRLPIRAWCGHNNALSLREDPVFGDGDAGPGKHHRHCDQYRWSPTPTHFLDNYPVSSSAQKFPDWLRRDT